MRYFNKTLEVELLGRKINTSKFCVVPPILITLDMHANKEVKYMQSLGQSGIILIVL
jgi:hypothetical protein